AALALRIDTIQRSEGDASPAHADGGATISADAQERLRALGYVTAAPSSAPAGDAPNPAQHIATWNAFEEALGALNARQPRALDSLAAANHDAPVFQSTYARALLDAGRPGDALAAYRDAAKRWPTDAVLLHDLAVAARAAKQLDQAHDAGAASSALAPESALAR